MKVRLMFQDRGVARPTAPAKRNAVLVQDLELDLVFEAMAAKDDFLLEACRRTLLDALVKPEEIRYRQRILEDCLRNPGVVRQAYALAVDALTQERKIWGWSSQRKSPEQALHHAMEVMRVFLPMLRGLRDLAQQQQGRFESDGFRALWTMLAAELTEDYLRQAAEPLERLRFPGGMRLGACLGEGNKGAHYVLYEPPRAGQWWGRVRGWTHHLVTRPNKAFTYEIAERDEQGFQALSRIQSQGIVTAAAALALAADHVQGFFEALRLELAFYVGCLNLNDRLADAGQRVAIPEPLDPRAATFSARGLYDAALALRVGNRVVPNDLDAQGRRLVMVTGANRGGKSTLLRSIGQAQVMMQCGMFVAAGALRASVCAGGFTHFKREEDASMRSGKLDEELRRLSAIVDELRPGALVLMNESFGSTNEREGSTLGLQVVRAFLERGIRVFYVTHHYELAHACWNQGRDDFLFLRAERLQDGSRTYRILQGEPLPTSFGQDLYQSIFGAHEQKLTTS